MKAWQLTRHGEPEGRIVIVGFASGDIPSAALNHALVKNTTAGRIVFLP